MGAKSAAPWPDEQDLPDQDFSAATKKNNVVRFHARAKQNKITRWRQRPQTPTVQNPKGLRPPVRRRGGRGSATVHPTSQANVFAK